MFRPLLAIFWLSLRELKVLLHNVRARDGQLSTSGLRNIVIKHLIDTVVFDHIPFPVLTHTTGMTHFQNFIE
jgi:hypothetical protein